MMFIRKASTLFVSLLAFAGSAVQPVARLNKTERAYTALSGLTFSESFDVLDQNTALKTALYLNAAPQETARCSALMNAFNQQVKYRPEVVQVLKQHNVIVDEPAFITNYAKAVASYFVTSGICYLINKEKMFGAVTAQDELTRETYIIYLIIGSLINPVISDAFGTIIFGNNPNAHRFANLGMPSRYQTFSHQMIDSIAQGLITSLLLRASNHLGLNNNELGPVKIALAPIIMQSYISWSRAKALAEFVELEKALPANLVTEVNELIKN